MRSHRCRAWHLALEICLLQAAVGTGCWGKSGARGCWMTCAASSLRKQELIAPWLQRSEITAELLPKHHFRNGPRSSRSTNLPELFWGAAARDGRAVGTCCQGSSGGSAPLTPVPAALLSPGTGQGVADGGLCSLQLHTASHSSHAWR